MTLGRLFSTCGFYSSAAFVQLAFGESAASIQLRVLHTTLRYLDLSGKRSRFLKAGPPEAILVIFGRRALIFFFVWKLLEKNEKWHHFCAHAQWWSPWRRKNVEKGHLAPSNLTFLIIAIDRNGFRRMKEEGLIYKTLPQIFWFLPWDLVMTFQSLVTILPHFFDFGRP